MNETVSLEFEAQKLRMELIKEIGFMGCKFMITLNSGAFIVLLTFLGNSNASTAFSINLQNLQYAMFAFLGAIIGTFLSMTIAYISAQFGLIGKTLFLGRAMTGHLFWMLVPLTTAFCLFVTGGYLAIAGIVVKCPPNSPLSPSQACCKPRS